MVAFKTLQAWLVSMLATHSLAAVHEMLQVQPEGWNHVALAADDHPISLQVALPEKNTHKIESTLMKVADPKSPHYQKHLSKAEVDKMFAAKEGSTDAVHAWLKDNGVDKVQTDGSIVNFKTTVGTANKMLNTKFSHYERNGVTKLRTMQYSLPDDLHKHVDFLSPTIYLGKTVAHAPTAHYNKEVEKEVVKRAGKLDPSCATSITPTCIHQLYNIDYTPKVSSGAHIGFGSFLNQSVRFADLAQFETQYKIPSQNITNVPIANPIDSQAEDPVNHGEADLDAELMVSTVGGLPITQYLTGGSPPYNPDINGPTQADNENEPYLTYYQYLLSQADGTLPQVISNSYGDDEQTVPIAYATKVCNMIAKMGMRGISVLESSGDTGVGAGCKTNDGKNTTTFMPTFPGTCPYVTIVGGLQSVSPEIAWTGSSGGFSNYFPQPSYQKSAVDNYIQTEVGTAAKAAYDGKYANFSGRAFPDISAHSLTPDYAVVYNSAAAKSGGTSAACPVTASIFTLLTDALLQAGKKPLGFLNPLLYSDGFAAANLNDITGGASIGCNGINGQTNQPVPGSGIVPGAAWNATEGWDPSTGLGSPDFGKLKAAVLGTASASPSSSPTATATSSPTGAPTKRARGFERPAVEVRWA